LPITTTVGSIANKRIISVDEGATVHEAIFQMVEHNIGSVVVNSAGKPKGVITERDLMRKVILQGMDVKKALAREIMSTPLITIDADAHIGEAAVLMFEKKIRRLLVTKNGAVIGIFTQRDLEGAALDYFLAVSRMT
jgi:CBS domain-containing protein